MRESATEPKRVSVSAKVSTDILDALNTLAKEQDRKRSNLIERILKNSPEVQSVLHKRDVETTAQTL